MSSLWPETVDGLPVVEGALVKVSNLPHFYADDRGTLLETLREDDEHFTKFGQIYVVSNPEWSVRAYHRHLKMYDWFTIIQGAATFVVWREDDGYDLNTRTYIPSIMVQRVTVRASVPKTITVPPGVWHGWTSIEKNTLLLSVASELYPHDGTPPDEERCAWDCLGKEYWRVQAK